MRDLFRSAEVGEVILIYKDKDFTVAASLVRVEIMYRLLICYPIEIMSTYDDGVLDLSVRHLSSHWPSPFPLQIGKKGAEI